MTTQMVRARASCLLAVFCVSGAWVAVAAQGAAQKPTVVPPPPAVARPVGQEAYSYKSEGRRDPFLSLVNRGTESRPVQKKPEGLRGLTFDEIALRGILQGGRPGAIAIVQAPDTRTYRVHVGDQLYDAVVKAITADSLVVLQEVSDPLSLQKQIERRKTLRVVEEVK
jgi:Tfp pilus assembly protein PilP